MSAEEARGIAAGETRDGPERTLSVRIQRPVHDFTVDVAFDVPPGVTVLFGPSGSGKTTILKCIAGIATPANGRIAHGDDVWFDDGQRTNVPSHRRRAALVFQSLALFPHLTAVENVAYGVPRDVPKVERTARAREMLVRMRVGHLEARRPRTFSGGEAQRVALARAFAMSPRVVLLDEPFSSLDAAVKDALLDETRGWIERAGVPALVVTHDPREAERLGARTIRIERGRLRDE